MFNTNKTRGQTLVIVALSMVVLVGFVALAVDAGNLYAERRHMQNAADAGALAGAREICFGDPGQAETKANEYAIDKNRGEEAQVEISDSGLTITVTVTETASTIFAGVIGFRESEVSARAAAVCGRAKSGSGLWPVAFAYDDFVDIYDGGDGCGETFIVWTDDKIIQCIEDEGVTEGYVCDLDGDGDKDVLAVGDRGWLDFSAPVFPLTDGCVQPGCGAAEVACQVLQDAGTQIELPTCIPGISGIKAGVANEVNARVGDTVRIPLFTSLLCEEPIPDGQALCDSGTGPTFWVEAFGCVTVDGWIQNYEIIGTDGKKTKGKVIEVSVDCEGCESAVGGTDGTPAEPWEMRAVSLIE